MANGSSRRRYPKPAAPTSWDPLAAWYDGWVGEGGSDYHREVAVPALLRALEPQPGESILDVGCGQGVLAPSVVGAGARYVGVDASPRLIQMARRHHGNAGRFLVGDARDLAAVPGLREGSFDAVVFLLSLQDMDPLERVLDSATSMVRGTGRMAILITHPAFRVPRQSGWGWDEGRKLIYRRVDRYLTPLPVPMKPLPGKDTNATTRSFHRPIEAYVNGLASRGLLTERMEEVPGRTSVPAARTARAERLARREIPLFLTIRARKVDGRPRP
ncbi:MAG: class I SAM-dependent methyltransferase [Chloroflexi bacterium]|nr:class I SAM-dependent methyltransferase [Chloroflexota bacterium]